MAQLVKYEALRREIANYTRVDECKNKSDQAEAMRVYARQAKDAELLDKSIEIKFLAQTRGGQLLIEMAKSGERQKPGDNPRGINSRSVQPLTPTLSDLGITKTHSSRWQALARMTQTQRDERLRAVQKKARGAIDAAAKQLRMEMRRADEARVKALAPIKGKFKTIIVDPPWDYEWLSIAGRASPGYATMTHDELMSLKVQQWAEENCHMYLWVTNNFMTRGVELMKQWGFQHKTVLTWRKLSKTGKKTWWGLGAYFRNSTEHVLFGVRGELRTRVDNVATLFEAPIRDHSEKPDTFYDIVRRASYLPAAELFQREEREGFVNVFQAAAQKEAAE